MRVLVACEFSGIVREAFTAAGHEAWSCDLLPTEIPSNQHIEGDILGVLNQGWDLMIAHPPCTYLTNAGVRWLYDHVCSRNGKRPLVSGQKRRAAMVEAAQFFNALKGADIPKIALENPIPHRYARELIGSYDQLYQPWMFGHGETKATCLWLKGLPRLQPTSIVEGRAHLVHNMSPGPNRWRERSRTLPGIAEAMAAQWGAL